MPDPLAPGATLGILGGGQLGRMLALAAARLGLRVRIYDPAADCPAGHVAAHKPAAWEDTDRLRAFAAGCDVVTYEFENIPDAALAQVEAAAPLRPGRNALHVSGDRLTEKTWLDGLDLKVAPFDAVDDPGGIAAAARATGLPAILKTRRLGYDGKGQARIADMAEGETAARALGVPCILEAVVPFRREVSVIGARGLDGSVACYDPAENLHDGGILRRSAVPATLPPGMAMDAVLIAGRILNALDYVGVLGVELFVTDGGLVVNEIAPRVHNSGHWTQDGCVVDQFEQHVRAVCGWPLGDGSRHSDVVMENLLGTEIAHATEIAREPAAALHLYGKAEARAGRKMGHVNRVVGPKAG